MLVFVVGFDRLPAKESVCKSECGLAVGSRVSAGSEAGRLQVVVAVASRGYDWYE